MADRATFTLDDAREIAERAHAGQVDKLGVDYMNHVESVAAGLVDFDLDLQIAGLLHDVVEDSDITIVDLRGAGASDRTLVAVELVSRNLHPRLTYLEGIERICQSYDASLVKISDNAHNSLQERVEALGKPADPKYADARHRLYAAVPRADIERILRRANPALLADLD